MTADGAATSFTAAAALGARRLACERTGLNGSGAWPLGPVGDNAVFRLPFERVVARVTWGMDALPILQRELQVAA
ncbi:hypothetical protein ACWEJ6_52535 [Nonomuraea sp. NPDC004702]